VVTRDSTITDNSNCLLFRSKHFIKNRSTNIIYNSFYKS